MSSSSSTTSQHRWTDASAAAAGEEEDEKYHHHHRAGVKLRQDLIPNDKETISPQRNIDFLSQLVSSLFLYFKNPALADSG